MTCSPAPTLCERCGELTQRRQYHREELDAGIPTDRRCTIPPKTHVPILGPDDSECICGSPLVHHFHGYDVDCRCERGDCRPVEEDVAEGPPRRWWTPWRR